MSCICFDQAGRYVIVMQQDDYIEEPGVARYCTGYMYQVVVGLYVRFCENI